MLQRFLFLTVFILCSTQLSAYKKLTPQDYIEQYKDDAIKEMKRAGVPASITLSQGMLESGYGNSELARKAKNHFGIKCHSDWKGATFRMDDDAKDECFRKYRSVLDSYRDHSDFLTGKRRYAALFQLKITDYKGWARGLRKAGYATNPKYAKLLIDMIERYDLHQYDKKQKKRNRRSSKKEEVPEDQDNRLEEEGDDDLEVTVGETHPILKTKHWVKYVEVKKGDTYYSIAQKKQIKLSRLYKYNECNEDTILKVGAKLFLQPKRNRGTQKTAIFQEGDNLYRVAQEYGIKLKHIYRRNKWPKNYSPKPGETIILRGRKK